MLKKLVMIVILASCFPLNSLAETQGLTIAGLLEKSGLIKQIEGMPEGLKLGLRRGLSRGDVPEKISARVEGVIDKAFEKDKVIGLLHQRVNNRFSEEELQRLELFLDSPLGKRLTAAENKMADVKEFKKVMDNSTKLVNEVNKNPVRVKLLQSLTEAMGGIERSVESALSVALAGHIALIHATPSMEMPPMEVLEKINEEQRFAITGMLTQLSLASSVHVYHPFSNAELKQYIEFASSPVATKFSIVIGDALIAVNKQCAKDMGEIAAEATRGSGNS